MIKHLKEIHKKYGNISVSWIMYKYRVSFKEAERMRDQFYATKKG